MEQSTKRQSVWILLGLLAIPAIWYIAPYKVPTLLIATAKLAIAVPVTAIVAWTLDSAFHRIEFQSEYSLALIYLGTCVLLGATL